MIATAVKIVNTYINMLCAFTSEYAYCTATILLYLSFPICKARDRMCMSSPYS